MGDWFWPFVLGVCVVACFLAYVIREERLSKIRFTDDQHENGPFGR